MTNPPNKDPEKPACLRVESLVFERWFIPVFEPINFQIEAGETLLIRGANGSGKTTLLRLLAGFLEPSEGKIFLPGQALAWLGHKLGIKDALSVRENLQFLARLYNTQATEALITDTITQLGLMRVADQDAGSLSAGQKKRCAFGTLLFQPDAIWLLDEPYSSLDKQGMDIVDRLLKQHQQRNGITVLATHGVLAPAQLEVRELIIEGFQDDYYAESLA
ncbi:MAG: heme ABC exporter ATP-binding protein CcmA [Xanthomonadales bacterium]|nr:heme ABC exporter ATP-binding protein CcmA [Xanthomonadales bacterium]